MKTAVNTITGNENAYLGEQPFQQDGLIEEISGDVFASEKIGGVFGPVESPLGWHVVVLKEIKEPHVKPYESVKDTLRNEILQGEFADQKYAIAGEIDDMLAGGAALEEVKQSYPMQTTSLEGITTMGAMASNPNPLDQFGEDAALITQLAFESFEGESAPVTELSDGRTAIIHVDKIIEKSYTPFEEVKDDIRESWMNDQERASNTEYVQELLLTAKTEGHTLQAIADENDKSVLTGKNLKRSEEIKSPMTQIGTAHIFKAELNNLIVFDIENGLAIGRVTSFDYPSLADIEEEELEAVQKAAMQDAADESISMFYENKISDLDVKVNEEVIKRLYGPSENSM
jgi:peptidyl-prolyl cis-trans isomerase D